MNTDDWLTIITVLGLGSLGVLVGASFVGIIMASRRVQKFPVLKKGRAFSWHLWGTVTIGFALLLHSLLSLNTTERTGITWVNILIPFTAPQETLLLGIGSIALYLLILTIAVSLTIRKKHQKIWRTLHYGTYIALILGTIHGLFISSTFQHDWAFDMFDAEKIAVELSILLIIISVVYRIIWTKTKKA